MESPALRQTVAIGLAAATGLGLIVLMHLALARFGLTQGAGVLALLISMAALLRLISEFQLDRIYRDWRSLEPDRQAFVFERMTPRIRRALLRRLKADRTGSD